jgi:hypothetical protein
MCGGGDFIVWFPTQGGIDGRSFPYIYIWMCLPDVAEDEHELCG